MGGINNRNNDSQRIVKYYLLFMYNQKSGQQRSILSMREIALTTDREYAIVCEILFLDCTPVGISFVCAWDTDSMPKRLPFGVWATIFP